MIVWRLEREEFISQAFQGHGSARFPGRWNPSGVPAAYASESRALATIEMLAHMSDSALRNTLKNKKYYHVSAQIPDDLETTILNLADVTEIHKNWSHTPPPDELKVYCGKWFLEKKAVVLRVPSAIIPNENNFVINPRHPDFSKILFGAPEEFIFDPRLV